MVPDFKLHVPYVEVYVPGFALVRKLFFGHDVHIPGPMHSRQPPVQILQIETCTVPSVVYSDSAEP